jgi:hypothetical protein
MGVALPQRLKQIHSIKKKNTQAEGQKHLSLKKREVPLPSLKKEAAAPI